MEKLEENKIRKIINVQDEIKKIELLNKEDLSDASKTYIIVNMSDKNKMKALQHIKLNDVQKLMIYYSIEDRKILDELINNNAIAKVRKNIENIKQKYSDTMCTSNLPAQMSTGYEFETNGILASIIDNNGFIVEGWKSEYDESIFNGIEIISPVLKEGNKEDIRNLYWVCDIMKELELEATDSCGGHIHYGANFLDSYEAYKILFEIWGNCEKIIFMMCNGEGQRLRKQVSEYAKPVSNKIFNISQMKNLDMMDFNEFILCVQEIFKDKFTAINMQNVNKKKKNTIEFRLSNCVFYDKNELKRNTELYGKILQISKELADIQNNIAKSDSQLYKMMLYKKLIMENSEKKMVELFLNLIFDEPEIRKIYRNRYLSSLNLLNLDKQKGIQNTINDLEFCQEKIILSSLLKLENLKTNNKQNNIFDER